MYGLQGVDYMYLLNRKNYSCLLRNTVLPTYPDGLYYYQLVYYHIENPKGAKGQHEVIRALN